MTTCSPPPKPDLAAIKRASVLLSTAQMLEEGAALLERAAVQRQRCADQLGADLHTNYGATSKKAKP